MVGELAAFLEKGGSDGGAHAVPRLVWRHQAANGFLKVRGLHEARTAGTIVSEQQVARLWLWHNSVGGPRSRHGERGCRDREAKRGVFEAIEQGVLVRCTRRRDIPTATGKRFLTVKKLAVAVDRRCHSHKKSPLRSTAVTWRKIGYNGTILAPTRATRNGQIPILGTKA
jgi:hypothetical protein